MLCIWKILGVVILGSSKIFLFHSEALSKCHGYGRNIIIGLLLKQIKIED